MAIGRGFVKISLDFFLRDFWTRFRSRGAYYISASHVVLSLKPRFHGCLSCCVILHINLESCYCFACKNGKHVKISSVENQKYPELFSLVFLSPWIGSVILETPGKGELPWNRLRRHESRPSKTPGNSQPPCFFICRMKTPWYCCGV